MLRVEVTGRSQNYPIYVQPNAAARMPQLLAENQPTAILVISDAAVWNLHRHRLPADLVTESRLLLLPQGELGKSLQAWQEILDFALQNRLDRNCLFVAIGGGAVGDCSGFAAATYLRGVRYANIPTTLLAQIDSAIGGKTAINHSRGKNLVGAFHHPDFVLIDPFFLKTLPHQEVVSGLGEMVKYAVIAEPRLLADLERISIQLPTPEDRFWQSSITSCCAIKAKIVSRDPSEKGIRAWLNFGHTAAHALEKIKGFGKIRHGQAVLAGMVLASIISMNKAGLPEPQARRVIALACKWLEEKIWQDISVGKLIDIMRSDKKNRDGLIRFVLLREIGNPTLPMAIEPGHIADAIRQRPDLFPGTVD